MIKGVKVIERSGKNGRVIHFQYKGVEYWNTTENFEEMQEEDFIKLHEESMKDKERWAEIDKRIATKHDSMTCLLYTSPSPRDGLLSRMPSSA